MDNELGFDWSNKTTTFVLVLAFALMFLISIWAVNDNTDERFYEICVEQTAFTPEECQERIYG